MAGDDQETAASGLTPGQARSAKARAMAAARRRAMTPEERSAIGRPGGVARALALTPERREAIARQAGRASRGGRRAGAGRPRKARPGQ